ncbi:MAG: crossover junction endodeoxyribonuclease RuvC [Opitutales bacterium]
MASSRQLWAQAIRTGKVGQPRAKGNSPVLFSGHRPAFRGRILGVDPSLRGTGLAVVDCSPPGPPRLLASTTVRNPARFSQADCLRAIADAIEALLTQYRPTVAAVEESVFVQNQRTALILGLSRGAVLTTLARANVEIAEYAPLRIKQAVTGHGRASKEQVGGLLRQHLGLAEAIPPDESDAAATALCHAFTYRG